MKAEAKESLLCMSGHVRRFPEANLTHSQPALSHDCQTRTIVQKVAGRAATWIVFILALFCADPAVWQ